MTRRTVEAICPYCRALVWMHRTGTLFPHRANGVLCRGSNRPLPPVLR